MRKQKNVKKGFIARKKVVAGIITLIILLIAGCMGFYYYKLSQAAEILPYIEQDLITLYENR